jgi:ParB family transcriptional regulator, chromosome partitioning protein
VLQLITAVRTDAGIEVRDGRRRTLAAREAKLPTIPLYIVDTPTSDDKGATAEPIAHQIVTNDQHSALTDAQRGGYSVADQCGSDTGSVCLWRRCADTA